VSTWIEVRFQGGLYTWAQHIQKVQQDIGIEADWYPLERLHVTFAYLGHMEPEQVDMLEVIVKQFEGRKLDINFDVLGSFSLGPGEARPLYTRPANADPLKRWHQQVQAVLDDKGLVGRVDRKFPYVPHLTLGRGYTEMRWVVNKVRPMAARTTGDLIIRGGNNDRSHC
jgi:2'-5' RNA ligase